MAKIEFVSYDGAYPNYCDGNLIIKVDGKIYENLSIVSGGSCYFTDDYTVKHIEKGPWKLDLYELPEELEPYIDEIETVINDNVPYGCCGGCL